MSQVSYGTITIVDTTDIARIYMVYAKSVSNTTPPSDELTWSESIASAPGEGDFIWQKTVVEKAITEEKTYSDPVCVTGSSGQGVEKNINYYCNYGQGQPEEDYSGWQLEIPEYDGNKPNYWTKVVVIYSDDTREDFQASGTIATFESEKVGTLDSLEVSLSPIQSGSGTPSPDNIRPISGWDSVETQRTGKNLLNPIRSGWSDVGTYLHINNVVPEGVSANMTFVDKDTSVNLSGINMGWVYEIVDNSRADHYKWCINNGAKIANTTNESNNLDSDRRICQNIFIYPKTEEAFNKLFARYDIQVEFGTSATSYEPYVEPTTITTTLPTTVYGGTVDVVSGVLTVDRAMVTLDGSSDESWTKYGTRTRFTVSVPDYTSPTSSTVDDKLIANYLQTVAKSAQGAATGVISGGDTGYHVIMVNVGVEDLVDMRAYLADNPLEVVYPLANPITYSLTPQEVQTLLGRNNVWSDGTVELRGHTISKRDVMIYKDNGLTDVVNKSAEANTNAAEALEKANDGIVSTTQLWYQTNSTGAPRVPASHSQVDQGTVTYNNWRSARPNNNVDSYKYYYYCYEYLHGDGTYTYSTEAILDTSNLSQYQIDQLQTRVKKIWSNSTGSYMASGINTGTGTNEVDIDDSSTYGFNSKSTTTGVSFNYNTIPLTSLGTDGIKLYSPILTNGVITGSRLDATLSTNGLILNKGGIKAREGYSDFIYLSTDPYGNYSINGSTGISDWKQIIGTKFGVRADGTLYASSVNIQGILTAGAGSTIGPWTVSNNAIYNPSTKSSFNSDTVNGVYIGTDGIALGQGVFKVGADGVLDASGVSVSGDLTATNGFTVAQNNKILTSITSNGLVVYDGNGIIDSNIVAKFTGDGAQIGQNDGQGSILLQDYHSLKMFDKEALEIMNAPEYTSASTYEIGDIVTRYITEWEGLRPIYYECIADISTPMLWDSSYWKVINLNSYFYISDLRDRSGVAKLTETFTISSYALNPQRITVLYPLKSIKQVVVNGSIVNHEVQYNTGEYNITFIRPLFSAGDIVSIEYETEGSDEYKTKESDESSKIFLKAYTLGLRRPSSNIGPMSITTGAFNVASGFFSQAGGFWTEALGKASHAEGYSTKAYGNYAHAEGYNTQAGEPFDPEIVYWDGGKGLYAHAEGKDTYARGSCSHVQNLGTYTIYDNETVIGRYNKKEANPHADFSTERWAFVIGNGTSDSDRSNALTVDWDGCLRSYDLVANSSATSYDEYSYRYNYSIADKTGEIIGAIGNHTYVNGSLGSFLTSRRLINNEEKVNTISVNIDNNGDAFYGITNPRAFCTALNLGQILSHEPDAVSCTSGRYMQIAYLLLTPGTWLINGSGYFPYVNTTGVRRIYTTLATSGYNNVTTGPESMGNQLYDQEPVTGAYVTFLHISKPITVTSNTTIRLIGWQNSGSAISVAGRLYAARLA